MIKNLKALDHPSDRPQPLKEVFSELILSGQRNLKSLFQDVDKKELMAIAHHLVSKPYFSFRRVQRGHFSFTLAGEDSSEGENYWSDGKSRTLHVGSGISPFTSVSPTSTYWAVFVNDVTGKEVKLLESSGLLPSLARRWYNLVEEKFQKVQEAYVARSESELASKGIGLSNAGRFGFDQHMGSRYLVPYNRKTRR